MKSFSILKYSAEGTWHWHRWHDEKVEAASWTVFVVFCSLLRFLAVSCDLPGQFIFKLQRRKTKANSVRSGNLIFLKTVINCYLLKAAHIQYERYQPCGKSLYMRRAFTLTRAAQSVSKLRKSWRKTNEINLDQQLFAPTLALLTRNYGEKLYFLLQKKRIPTFTFTHQSWPFECEAQPTKVTGFSTPLYLQRYHKVLDILERQHSLRGLSTVV